MKNGTIHLGPFETKDGFARLRRSQIYTEMTRGASAHWLEFEVATMTRQQAEALQIAFLDWLGSLEFATVCRPTK